MELQKPLLRNDQVIEMEGDRAAAEKKLQSSNFQGDKSAVAEQLRALNHQLETQRPRAYGSDEIDSAVRREKELRGKWTQGMLSQEEMRKCPPGAVDRHRAWEKRNSSLIEEWQNIRRRLNAGSEDTEYASIENYRPTASSMNMDNALISGKTIYLPSAGAGNPVIFSNEQLAALRELSPELADKIGSLSNPQRQEVKDTLTGGIGFAELSEEEKNRRKIQSEAGKIGVARREAGKKRVMSDQQKAAMKAGREAAAARKAA